MVHLLINLVGLFFVATAVAAGFGLGTRLYGEIGGLLGVAAGAVWGFRLAANGAELLRECKTSERTPGEGCVAVLSESARSCPSRPKSSWLRPLRKESSGAKPDSRQKQPQGLDEIHQALKRINSHLWRELRGGPLAGCHALLYTVRLEERGEGLGWREVNRKLLSCLHRFETATTDEERRAGLGEALDRVGQKLQIVKEVASLKAETLSREEQAAVQQKEAELWRLSRLLRS